MYQCGSFFLGCLSRTLLQHNSFVRIQLVLIFTAMTSYINALQIQLQTRGTLLQVVEAGVVLFIALVAFFGNFLVCWAVGHKRQLRTVPNMFIASLAVSDMSMAVFVMPLTFHSLVSSGWASTTHACVMQGYLIFAFAMASLHTLTAISIDRYFYIVRPNMYRNIYTKKNTLVIILAIWASVFVYPLPPAFISSMPYSFQPGKCTCMYFFESSLVYSLFLDVLFIGTPMTVMIACYFMVFLAARQNNRQVAVMKQDATVDNASIALNIEEVKITKSLAVLLIAFAACWGPVGVVDVMDLVNGEARLSRAVYMFYIVVVFLSCSLNPFIYGLMNRKFRREIRKFFSALSTPCVETH